MELKANELRVGNYLKRVNELVIVNNVFIGHFNCSRLEDGVFLGNNFQSNFTPIPITKDILLKCGGEINRKLPGIKVDRFRLIWKESYNYWYVIDNQTQTYLTKLEFVHEFQNFVFVMNGTELNINL